MSVGSRFGSTPRLSVENAAIIVGAVVFVLVVLVALVAFWGDSLPIAGPGSLGQFAAITAGIVAFLAYPVGRLRWRQGLTPFRVRDGSGVAREGGGSDGEGDGGGAASAEPSAATGTATADAATLAARRATPIDVFDTIAIAFAHAILVLLGWLVLGAVLAEGFQGASVYFLSATVLAAAVAAVSAYAVFLSAAGMDLLRLSTVLAAFAVIGILTAMLSAPDPQWWMLHLSALGMTKSISSLTFNLTLIVAGVIVTAIARYATDVRSVVDPARRAAMVRVRIALILIGVLLACVGVFSLNISELLHNVSAVGMVVVFALAVFWVRGAMPQAPRSFFILGYVFFATIVVVLVFFAIGYYVLTAAELVAGVLVFSWLIVYLRVSGAALER